MDRPEELPWTNDPDADRLLASSDLALLIGMLLDQQFPMERAFYGPKLLTDRLGQPLTSQLLADFDPDELHEVFRGPPAIHRYPNAMADRTQDLSRMLLEKYDGDAGALWETAENGADLLRRLHALPGFGVGKARIFVGVLGKRIGIRPPGWETEAADWPSIADVAKWEDIAELRAKKRVMKEKRKKEAGSQ